MGITGWNLKSPVDYMCGFLSMRIDAPLAALHILRTYTWIKRPCAMPLYNPLFTHGWDVR